MNRNSPSNPPFVWQNLAQATLKSSTRTAIVVIFTVLFTIGAAHAHEVRPAIADIQISAEKAAVDVRLSLEPLVVGINLQGLKDTNDAPQAADYDALRAKPMEDLVAAFRAAWPTLRDKIRLTVDGTRQSLDLVGVTVLPAEDPALPRDSRIRLEAALPTGTGPVTFGWAPEFGPLVLRQVGAGEDAYTGYLRGGADSTPLPRVGIATESIWTVFARYIGIGFEHIVPKGLDHILFVLGLFFLSMKMRPLIVQVTAFTVAHTVTLALASLGLVTVPATVVEPLIAASIVYVAIENVIRRDINMWRTAVVFGFGLLHGLGFASVLGDIGLDAAQFTGGLIGFNVGVELGQLSVILAAYLMVGLPFKDRDWYRTRIAVPASLAIGAVGAFWFVERIAG